jgi:shikimate kinase
MARGNGMDRTNIILVGFMGTGKTATARLVARRLERQLIDMDALIESREGLKVSAIFAEKGEPYFRERERELVLELAERRNLVIAAGGGVVINPENISHFNRTGVVICLKASPEAILRRVGAETHRPLLEGEDKARRIIEVLDSRRPLYDAIPHQVDTSHLTPDLAAARVIALYEQAGGTGTRS